MAEHILLNFLEKNYYFPHYYLISKIFVNEKNLVIEYLLELKSTSFTIQFPNLKYVPNYISFVLSIVFQLNVYFKIPTY